MTSMLLGCILLFQQGFPQTEISYDRLHQWPRIEGRAPVGVEFNNKGDKISFLWNKSGERYRDIYILSLTDLVPVQLTSRDDFPDIPLQDDTRTEQQKKEDVQYDGGPSAPKWSPDDSELLIEYKGDLWVMEPKTGSKPKRIIQTTAGEYNAQYSPNGKYISYMSGGNVFTWNRSSGEIKQLTTIAKSGTSLSGYLWSDDSSFLVVWWSDNNKNASVLIPDYTTDNVTVRNVPRGFVGTDPYVFRTGIVSSEGGLIKWVEGIPESSFNYGTDISPDGRYVVISEMDGAFKEWRLNLVDVQTMKTLRVFSKKVEKGYISQWCPVRFSRDGKSIYFGADLDGWRHIYRISLFGRDLRAITSGKFDVIDFQRPKDSDVLYYQSTERGPQQIDIYSITPEGKKTLLSVGKGANSVSISKDGKNQIITFNNRTTPQEIYLFKEVNNHVKLTNSPLPIFEKFEFAKVQEVTFPLGEEIIHGLLYTPPNIVPGKKYPAIIADMYANSAKWGWGRLLNHYAAVHMGYVILFVDFRASWGYGTDFETGYYESLGIIDSDEAVAAANFLKSLNYVDGERLGLWGWSYGGFLTLMTMMRHPGVFKAGVAIASVTDWRKYNQWYTRQRLEMPKENEEAYKATSPIDNAEKLQGHLLMIHGLQDDNVLAQDTIRLAQKLLELNKEFDLFLYPKDGHGMSRDESWVDVFRRIMRYFMNNL